MEYLQWMILPYRRYFDFSGRSRRKEYWMFALFNILVSIVIDMLFGSATYQRTGFYVGFSTELSGTSGMLHNLFGLGELQSADRSR